MSDMNFLATIESNGGTATGIVVPDAVVDALGSGKRPKVTVTLNGYSYRTTVARMGGRFLIPLAAEHRAAAGVSAGDRLAVDIDLDTAPREVTVPDDLAAALGENASARALFDQLSYTHRKEWVRWVEDAKKPETRASRIARTVTDLASGKRMH
jgi:hypothetical protein